jgi:hypothetical protein
MGYDAECTLSLDGRVSKGRAVLEQQEIVFRGPTRLEIPLGSITSATSRNGSLEVRFANSTARFDLGPAAAKWAARITNPPSRLDKLGVKAGLTVITIDIRDDRFLKEMIRRSATMLTKARKGEADLVFFGAESRAALDKLAALASLIKSNGAFWVIRPKGKTVITEADVMAAGKKAGLVDVKVVSFSETHTAEKFVIPVAKRQAAAPVGRRRAAKSSSSGRS